MEKFRAKLNGFLFEIFSYSTGREAIIKSKKVGMFRKNFLLLKLLFNYSLNKDIF